MSPAPSSLRPCFGIPSHKHKLSAVTLPVFGKSDTGSGHHIFFVNTLWEFLFFFAFVPNEDYVFVVVKLGYKYRAGGKCGCQVLVCQTITDRPLYWHSECFIFVWHSTQISKPAKSVDSILITSLTLNWLWACQWMESSRRQSPSWTWCRLLTVCCRHHTVSQCRGKELWSNAHNLNHYSILWLNTKLAHS